MLAYILEHGHLKGYVRIIDSPDPFIYNNPMIKLPCLSNELTHSE